MSLRDQTGMEFSVWLSPDGMRALLPHVEAAAAGASPDLEPELTLLSNRLRSHLQHHDEENEGADLI